MKATFLRIDKKNKQHLKLHTLKETAQRIGGDDHQEEMEWLREFCRMNYTYATFKYMHRLPVVCPSAEMKADKDGNLVMHAFNGLMVLTIGTVNSQEEADSVKRMVAMLPMTVMAVWGSSGRTVKVVVRIGRPDGTLPQTEDAARRLCQQAGPLVSQLYEVALRHANVTDTLAVGPALHHCLGGEWLTGFRMTRDKTPYTNDSASALMVPDDIRIDTSLTMRPQTVDAQAEAEPNVVGQETRKLIDLLEKNYTFRMNKVMGYVEYRSKAKPYYPWMPVDERVQNSLAMEARLAGLNVWDKDINRYVKSNMVRNYNPIEDYLWEVRDKWDGQDHIGALAATVPTGNPHWPLWFRTWFLGMVAQWLGRNIRYGNALVPLLISRQGYNKSNILQVAATTRTAVGLQRQPGAVGKEGRATGHEPVSAHQPRRVQPDIAQGAGRVPQEPHPAEQRQGETPVRQACRGFSAHGIIHSHCQHDRYTGRPLGQPSLHRH